MCHVNIPMDRFRARKITVDGGEIHVRQAAERPHGMRDQFLRFPFRILSMNLSRFHPVMAPVSLSGVRLG